MGSGAEESLTSKFAFFKKLKNFHMDNLHNLMAVKPCAIGNVIWH